MATLHTLPTELVAKIVLEVNSPDDLLALSLTCKKMNEICCQQAPILLQNVTDLLPNLPKPKLYGWYCTWWLACRRLDDRRNPLNGSAKKPR